MTNDLLVDRYKKYLLKLKNANGFPYGTAYVKDKISRLRRMLQVVDVSTLNNISGNNFLSVCDEIMCVFTQIYPSKLGTPARQYGDYLVVIRQIYHMNTGETAPRYVHYSGVRRA